MSTDGTRVWVPPLPGPLEVAAGAAAGVGAIVGAPVLGPLVRAAFTPLRAPGTQAAADPPKAAGPADPGWFGPDSVAWRAHADVSMLVAGMTAFALQALHPLAMAGVWDHSAFGGDFFGRVRRTGEFVQGVVYDPAPDAERRCAAVRRIHRRVVGVAPDGRPYDASHPELLDWVHLTEYLAIAAANRRFAAHPMGRDELDRYVAETARVGEAMGVADPPRSWSELYGAFERHRRSLALGDQAATAIAFLERPSFLPPAAAPPWRAVWGGALAVLPPPARKLLRAPMPNLAEVAACRAVVRALGRYLATPAPLLAARARLGLD
ncbi:MAG: oxygenase MpaB family protein [Acidimicrobiia bacterium]